jgi:hypothetical protein
MNINEEGKAVEEDPSHHSDQVNESLNKSKDSKLNKSKDSTHSKTAVINDDYKYEIPDSCYITLCNVNKIEKLDKGYYLMAHPYPLLEGEMIILQPLESD